MKFSTALPWVLIVIIIVGLGAYIGTQQPSPPSQKITVVDFSLNFVATGIETPFYVGVDRGSFAKYGLQVNVLPNPQGSVGAIRALAAKKVDFAKADVGTLMTLMAKENIANIRAIAVFYSKNPMGIQYLIGKDRPPINSLKDLEGKSLGDFTGNSANVMFPVLCKANGVDYSKVKMELASPVTLNSALLTGKVDAVNLYSRNVAVLRDDAAKQGLRVGNFAYADNGLDIYADMLLTRTDVIASNPDLVKKFVQGFEEALQYAVANPAEAVSSELKFNPQLNANVTRGEWDITAELMGGKAILNAKDPLVNGWIDPVKMSKTISTVSAAFSVPAPNPTDVYTNQFVKSPQ